MDALAFPLTANDVNLKISPKSRQQVVKEMKSKQHLRMNSGLCRYKYEK